MAGAVVPCLLGIRRQQAVDVKDMVATSSTEGHHMTAEVTPLDELPSNVSRLVPESRLTIVAGVLLFLGGATVLMGIITAEALYPAAYSTHSQSVSDLAANAGRTTSFGNRRRQSST